MKRVVAKVVVSKAIYAIDRPFDYLVPVELIDTLEAGMRVLVPFGQGNRGAEGMVLALSEHTAYMKSLKIITAQLDEAPILNQEGIQLAIWMREHYYCTTFECVRTMLPTGLFFALKDTLVLDISNEEALLRSYSMSHAHRLVEYLIIWEGRGDMHDIRAAFGTKDPNPAIRFLINEGIAVLDLGAKRKIGDKTDLIVALAVPAEEALQLVLPKKKQSPLRYAVVELLSDIGKATSKELCYYTGATTKTIKSLEKSGIVQLQNQEHLRSPHKEEVVPAPPPILNEEQENALNGLMGLLGQAAAALLYGITGSGKTQVYIALIHHLLKQGKSALVLVPEISLTPQLLRIFSSQFGDNIAILHSGLPMGERYDEWKRIKRGDAKVVLGTRSAIFAPLENLGVIILDEEQEQSYKSDRAPRYHARDIAKYRCVKQNSLLLLGSATPSVDSMYRAQANIYHLFTMKNRFNQNALPEVTIVDMKDQLKRGNETCISTVLQAELHDNQTRGEQAILFLNRRGTNQMLTCNDCGHIAECSHCSVRLTYHKANNRLMCHYCGFSMIKYDYCPECNGRLSFFGCGTQQVESDLEDFMSSRKIIRMDTDTVSAAHPHEEMFQKFEKDKVPVLIGTQMVAKGLDFENVTLVGVISGDLSLFIDDLWAGERTFCLITQVVGRAGRGGKKGRAIIQTYTPDHDIIQAAAKQDYDGFYQQEISLRQLRDFPPFQDVILIAAAGPIEFQVIQAMRKIKTTLQYETGHFQKMLRILGPAPAPVPKINNRFRFRITLMGEHSKELRQLLAHILTCAQQDKENKMVSIYIDRLR